MKYNPFQPNKIVAPGMFVGRGEELIQIEKFLFQTQHSNPQNFLIMGERGIGKSSLLLFVDRLAAGNINTSEGKTFRFVTCSVDLGSCQDELDIVRSVARGIKVALQEEQKSLAAAKTIFDFLTSWEVLGVRYHKQSDEIDPEDVCDILVGQVAEFCRLLQGDRHGIVLLLDEADQPPSAANLGKFCKYFTERLTKKGCEQLILGVAGLPNTLTKMSESHESSPRLFDILRLEPLELEERKRVVETGLNIANSKNVLQTSITPSALEAIAELSEGYPHFVQQFAYSAFDYDTDEEINSGDVFNGAYMENGAIAQLGLKYFNEMYFSKISSDDYRKVLDTMAKHNDKWVSRKELISESKLKDTTINNAVNALKTRGIILADDTRQGHYRLPTKSFAVWINAVNSLAKNNPNVIESLETVFEAN